MPYVDTNDPLGLVFLLLVFAAIAICVVLLGRAIYWLLKRL